MRGAYYVTTALLVVASSRIAVESGKLSRVQTYIHDVMAANNVDVTTLPQRFLRGSRDVRDNLVHTGAHEERKLEYIPLTAADILRKVSTRTAMTDKEKGVVVLATSLIEAIRKAHDELGPSGGAATVATYDWISNEWMELAKKIHLQPPKVIESPVVPDGAYGAGQPGTSRRRKHLASTVEEHNLKKRGPLIIETPSGNAQPVLQVNSPSATTTSDDPRLDQLSKTRLELTPEMWAMLIDMRPTSNKFNFDRAIPLRNKRLRAYLPQTYYDKRLDTTHNKFFELCSPSYNPTKHETAYIWSSTNRKKNNPAINQLQARAKYDLVNSMLTLMEDDVMWKYWVLLPESRKIEILNDLLNVHYQRWVWMYRRFIHEKFDIPTPFAPPESATKGLVPNVSPGTQASFGDNMGTSSAFAPPGHVTSQKSHLVPPTPKDLTTIDFLSGFGKSVQPSLDGNIGEYSDQAPSVHLKLGVP